jgi:hypothetical protein
MATPPDMIAVKDVIIEGFNPALRTTNGAMRGLVEQVRRYGRVLVPIILTKDNRLIDGHRRVAAAKELGIECVPCIFIDGDPRQLFSALNNSSSNRALKPTEWMDFYLQGGDVPSKDLVSKISGLEKLVGRRGLRELADRGISPSIYQWVVLVSNYCDDTSHKFMTSLLWWMINHRMSYTARKAVESGTPPQMIFDAIQSDKPLSLKRQYEVS